LARHGGSLDVETQKPTIARSVGVGLHLSDQGERLGLIGTTTVTPS
jgi:hypothetical protein